MLRTGALSAKPTATASTSSDTDCTPCLSRGIIPLTADKSDIYDEIAEITDTDPDGNTNIQQGLYWGWEVLWPGIPFEEAIEEVPFPRRRAVILMTDGLQVGGNGDAYKGRFGSGEGAGTVDLDVHGDVSVDSTATSIPRIGTATRRHRTTSTTGCAGWRRTSKRRYQPLRDCPQPRKRARHEGAAQIDRHRDPGGRRYFFDGRARRPRGGLQADRGQPHDRARVDVARASGRRKDGRRLPPAAVAFRGALSAGFSRLNLSS